MSSVIESIPNGNVGLTLLVIGIVFGWIAIHLNVKMQIEVNRLAPSRARGLSNLRETIDTGRIWREHRRLFPKSNLRTRATLFFVLSVVVALVGFILFGFGV